MAIFPKIQSPCPYKNDLASIMDGDVCRLCKRQVFDLTDMSDSERVTFMKGCAGEVCVSYRYSVRPALAAAAFAVAAVAVPTSAAAQIDTVVVVAGGVKDLNNVQYVENPGDSAIPELPVVYERRATDQKPAGTHRTNDDAPAAPVSSTAAL